MKNVYLIETKETCEVWKQYAVEAYTMEQAKDMVLRGDLYDSGEELDHYIISDLGVNEIQKIKHCGTKEEA
jgi:hypothetical protein